MMIQMLGGGQMVKCDDCMYLRRTISYYRSNDDLFCYMDNHPSERPKFCEFYSPKIVEMPDNSPELEVSQ